MASGERKRNVVIAINFHECSDTAFDWYVEYLHREGNYAICVFIPEGFDLDKYQKELAKGNQMTEQLEKGYSKIIQLESKYTSRMAQHKVQGRVLSIPGKSPGQILVKTALEENAFAIIMGCRGLSKLKKAILGSVSDYVVSTSNVPVIVVRAKTTS